MANAPNCRTQGFPPRFSEVAAMPSADFFYNSVQGDLGEAPEFRSICYFHNEVVSCLERLRTMVGR